MSTKKKLLSEQAKEDKSSRTIYGSELESDEMTRNASNGKGRWRNKEGKKGRGG